MRRRVLGFGWTFGTVFTLIVVYFIFLYAKDRSEALGWKVLMFLTGGYLVLTLLFFALVIVLPLLILLIALIFAAFQHKRRKKSAIDVEYEVKE